MNDEFILGAIIELVDNYSMAAKKGSIAQVIGYSIYSGKSCIELKWLDMLGGEWQAPGAYYRENFRVLGYQPLTDEQIESSWFNKYIDAIQYLECKGIRQKDLDNNTPSKIDKWIKKRYPKPSVIDNNG